MQPNVIKGIDHPKMTFLSLFTNFVPNLYSFLSCTEHKRRYVEECNQTVATIPLSSFASHFEEKRLLND